MALFNEIDPDTWRRILDEVSARFGIHTTLSDEENKVALEGGQNNPLCSRVRARPESLMSVCSQTAQGMIHEARAGGAPVADLCELGMFKTVVPIIDGGTYLGSLSACGLVLDEEPLEVFLVAKVLGIEEEEAEGLVAEVSVIDGDAGRAITDAFVSGLEAARRGR